MFRSVLLLGLGLLAAAAGAEGLTPERLGVIYNRDDPGSTRTAVYYASRRGVPAQNLVPISLIDKSVMGRAEFSVLRKQVLSALPADVQSVLLIWSKPYAVECMSITTA